MKGLRRPKADKGVLEGIPPRSMSLQANRRSRSERSEDARDIRRRGTLGAAPLIKPSPYRNEKSHRISDGS